MLTACFVRCPSNPALCFGVLIRNLQLFRLDKIRKKEIEPIKSTRSFFYATQLIHRLLQAMQMLLQAILRLPEGLVGFHR